MASDAENRPPACDLCGLLCRSGAVTLSYSGRTYRFCCNGCRQVFVMLLEQTGAEDPSQFQETPLYRKCVEMGIIPSSQEDLDSRSSAPPDPVAAEAAPSEIPPGENDRLLPLNLQVTGMWCAACAWVIEAALDKAPGVSEPACSFSTDRLRCRFDPVATSPQQIIESINNLGYRARLPGDDAGKSDRFRETLRFCVSAFLTMNVMMFSFGVYSGFFTQFTGETIRSLSIPSFAMASIVLFYGGFPILRRAISGLRYAAASMDTLITLGSVSAYGFSVLNMVRGSIHLYFDTASMLITLVLLGKMIESRARRRVSEDLEAIFAMVPTKVRICPDIASKGKYAAIEQLSVGDYFRCAPGEVVPADGVVMAGEAGVDESSLTGEALPRTARHGNRVRSGVKILSGEIVLKAEAVGEASTLGAMVRIMETALTGKSALQALTDRALRWFVPMVISLAAGTGLVCYFTGLSAEAALMRGLTVLVISCPCALGVAIPLARAAGIALAGKKGMLVRDFAAFETAPEVEAFVFDKTGTVTDGNWRLLEVLPVGSDDAEKVLAVAAALEQGADHVIAGEIRRQAVSRGLTLPGVAEPEIAENGVSGKVEGRCYRLGARGFALEAAANAFLEDRGETGNTGPGVSSVFMSKGEKPWAVFRFGDTLREGAGEVVRLLSEKGARVALVSGDQEQAVKQVAERIGITRFMGDRLPLEKAEFINALKQEGLCTAMIGDGVNDAPALVAADLSLAVLSGASLSAQAADVTLMRGDIRQAPEFLDLAVRVNRKIRQNFALSLTYNLVSIPVAMSGLLTPLIAVCAMLLSSLSVIGNTLRLLGGASSRNVSSGSPSR